MGTSRAVDSWFAKYENPMKPVVLRVRSKQHASLLFHLGAKILGKHPRLEGSGDTSRVFKAASLAEADRAKPDLERVVRAWCAWRDDHRAKPARKPKPKPTSRKPTRPTRKPRKSKR